MRVNRFARLLKPMDRIVTIDEDGRPSTGTVFSAKRSENKTEKAQNYETGNITRGIHVIFDDAAECLLHPDELVELIV